jgi:hypothetical protein
MLEGKLISRQKYNVCRSDRMEWLVTRDIYLSPRMEWRTNSTVAVATPFGNMSSTSHSEALLLCAGYV